MTVETYRRSIYTIQMSMEFLLAPTIIPTILTFGVSDLETTKESF
jgi:hypothetical protein